MAAPILRHYSATVAVFAAANTEYAVGPAVPAGRALVVSKIVVVNGTGGAVTFSLRPGAGHGTITAAFTLGAGEVYAETGLVLVAGEQLTASTNTVNGIAINLFGQEVDN